MLVNNTDVALIISQTVYEFQHMLQTLKAWTTSVSHDLPIIANMCIHLR